ncbi:MAG: nucleoside-diphosphate-sugar pyrophosphorylase [Candidatus Eisenbacteria bacterium RBG_16_71_46]|nr:MAG: nucleoside-diphosphate-sugar pyrophosphorylase [Candidatus Eisenbacteria bacterium RBG_16_71_46]
MRAVILAGGEGTRLRPYTTVLPKPLMPVGEMPILEIVLRQLKHRGFDRVTLAVSYLAELIEAFCGDGSRFGLEIRYSREPRALSTAGPLKLVPGLDETFLVMNGDVLTTLDYAALVRFHRDRGAAATIAMHRRTIEIDFGVIEAGADGALERYIEKPRYHYTVSMGVNVLEPRALAHIGENEALGMPDLLLRLKAAGETVVAYEEPCLWLDIGRVDDYEKALDVFASRRAEFLAGSAEP